MSWRGQDSNLHPSMLPTAPPPQNAPPFGDAPKLGLNITKNENVDINPCVAILTNIHARPFR